MHPCTLTIMKMLIIEYSTTEIERFFTIALMAKAMEVLEIVASDNIKKCVKNLSALD